MIVFNAVLKLPYVQYQGKTKEVLDNLASNRTLSVHLWGRQSASFSLSAALASDTALAALARKNCPEVVKWVAEDQRRRTER